MDASFNGLESEAERERERDYMRKGDAEKRDRRH